MHFVTRTLAYALPMQFFNLNFAIVVVSGYMFTHYHVSSSYINSPDVMKNDTLLTSLQKA